MIEGGEKVGLFGSKKKMCYRKGRKWRGSTAGCDVEKFGAFEEGVCKRCGETYFKIQPLCREKED